MYRTQDITDIKAKLDDLSKESDKIRLNTYEPTLNQLDKIYQDLYKYAKEHKLIIYGGFAQNLLIKNKKDSDAFYNEYSLADMEFYSYEPIKLSMDIAKYLYTKGYPYIQATSGVHEDTYKIFVNFHNFCDISYMPKYIYNNLPTKNIDGFIVTDPHFMSVDAFRVYSDPIFSFFRLEKTFTRFNTLLKHYPLYNSKAVIPSFKVNGRLSKDIFDTLKKEFIHNKDLIVIHHYAYNYLIKKSPRMDLIVDIPYLSVISVNYTKDVIAITKKLQKIYPKIKIKEYYPFFQFLGRKTEFYLDNKLIFIIYSHNDRCTVYEATFSENKKTHFGTFSLQRLMLIAEYYNQMIHKNKSMEKEYFTLLQNLFNARLEYLEDKDKTVMDNSPFQEFTFECLGKSLDPMRNARLKIMEKLKQGKQVKFNFDPDRNKEGKVPNYNFPNVSGNPIINTKDMTISK